jgi:hypothetical protein
MRPVYLVTCLLLGCTFEPGQWFATLKPSLTAAYVVRPDRDAGAGWQKLSNDYEVRISDLRVEVGELGLLASSGGGGTAKLDPSKPPPGYTLCHNGHCHHVDGRLVPYAEIEAELAGGGGASGLQTVVSFPVEGVLGLVPPVERALSCKPSCNLDRTTIVRATARLASVTVEGAVRDARSPSRLAAELPFRWQLRASGDGGAPGPALDAELDLPADHKHPPLVTLQFRLALAASLFDGVEFAGAPAAAGIVELSASGSPAAEQRLLQNLREETVLTASISRNDH